VCSSDLPSPAGGDATAAGVKLRIRDFKTNARRLLRADHPLLKILALTPDEVDARILDARIDDWLALLAGD
jgi:hypothetical protein